MMPEPDAVEKVSVQESVKMTPPTKKRSQMSQQSSFFLHEASGGRAESVLISMAINQKNVITGGKEDEPCLSTILQCAG